MSSTQPQPIIHSKKRTASDASLAVLQPRTRPVPVTPGATVTSSNVSVQVSNDEPGSPMEGIQTTTPPAEITISESDLDDTLDRVLSSDNPTPIMRTTETSESFTDKASNRQDTPLQGSQIPPLPRLTVSEREAMEEIDGSRNDEDEDLNTPIISKSAEPPRAAEVQVNKKILQTLSFIPVNSSQGTDTQDSSDHSTVSSSYDGDYSSPAHQTQGEAPHTPDSSPPAAAGPNSVPNSTGGHNRGSSRASKPYRSPAHDADNIQIYDLRQQGKDFDTIAKEMNENFSMSNNGRIWTRAACDGRFRRNGELIAKDRGERWNRIWYMHMQGPIEEDKIKPKSENSADERRGEVDRSGSGESTADEEDLNVESSASPRGDGEGEAEKSEVAVLLGLLSEKIDGSVQEACSRRTGMGKSVEELKALLVKLAASKE